MRRWIVTLLLLTAATAVPAVACAQDARIAGRWVLNRGTSDDIDKAVEKAVKAAGGKIKPPPGTNRRTRGRYRGGPEDQVLYDHISYEEGLEIAFTDDLFHFAYPDKFTRRFSTEPSTRSQSASGTSAEDQADFSFGYWQGQTLMVESRPRDYGYIMEAYRILPETGQLELTVELKPGGFQVPIRAILIFDRAGSAETRE
jgi:hypothetical protein